MENIDLEETKNTAHKNSTTARLNGATQFTIPALKIPPKLLGGSQELSNSASNINKFLLKQLNDEQTTTANRFTVPQLQQRGTFKIPELKIGQQTKIAETAKDLTKTQQTFEINLLDRKPINSLSISTKEINSAEENIIDLTAALSTTRIGNPQNIRGSQKNKDNTEQFEIPFIDCDRTLPPTNEYCGIDISHAKYKHNLVPPSNVGKILSSKNNKFKIIRREEKSPKLKPKHQIERFLFDSQSPDDMVLAALNRFTRP